ncbi:MAG: hypothetical protein IKK41_06765 [Oscillospiraceae bacterium]|nr:hypothetical protein [Oscillospiraceae bacterium]
MSIDKLQKKIRKLKNPTIVDLTMTQEDIAPTVLAEAGAFLPAYEKVCTELLEGLQEIVPAVRLDFNCFVIYGTQGLSVLDRLLKVAKEKEYFVLLDGLNSDKTAVADYALHMPCDGLSLMPYLGSDHIKTYTQGLAENDKSLFVTLRTPNRSASEIQDLMTGSRLVHQAAADVLGRLGEGLIGKCGYTQIAATAAANAPDSLRHLRSKYNRLFLLVDGYDYSNANAKNCSYAFDQFGHGAVVCSGTGITAAWKEQGDESNYVQCAVEAAHKMQKNILRYITIL